MRIILLWLLALSSPALSQQMPIYAHASFTEIAAIAQEQRVTVDTDIHLKMTLGVPLQEFKQQHPQIPCTQNSAASFCKFPQLPKEFCTMMDCLGGSILFADGKTCGLIADATSYEWVFVKNLMNKAHPVLEKIQETPTETVYVSHWKGKKGSLFFTQSLSKLPAHPPIYRIGFVGNPPHACYGS